MRLALLSAACISLLVPAVASAACKCISGEPKVVFAKSNLAIEGKLVSSKSPESEPKTVRYTFEVTKSWKGGDVGDKVIAVGDKDGECAVKLTQGTSYLVGGTDEGMGFPSLKPCHPLLKPSNAKDAESTRKALDKLKQDKVAADKAESNPTDDTSPPPDDKMQKVDGDTAPVKGKAPPKKKTK